MHNASLVIHECDLQLRSAEQSKRNAVEVVSCKNASLQSHLPCPGGFLPEIGVTDPFQLRPEFFYLLGHGFLL